jgi:hypothetical protein
MSRRAKKSTRLTVSLDPEDHAALATLATKSDVSLSWVVRYAIHRFIQQHQANPELPLALLNEPPVNRHATLTPYQRPKLTPPMRRRDQGLSRRN